MRPDFDQSYLTKIFAFKKIINSNFFVIIEILLLKYKLKVSMFSVFFKVVILIFNLKLSFRL